MTHALLQTALLSAGDPFNSMGRSFRGDEAHLHASEVLAALAFLVGIVVVAWLLSRALSRQERELRCNSPRGLFGELCRAHGLSRTARRRLARMARRLRLEDPALLFLDPRLWDEAQNERASERQRDEVTALREQLFGPLRAGSRVAAGSTA